MSWCDLTNHVLLQIMLNLLILYNMWFHPLIHKIQAVTSPDSSGMPYTNTHKHRTSYFKSTLTFLGPTKRWKYRPTKTGNSCGSSTKSESVVALSMRGAPSANANFQITFLLTRLLETLYENLLVLSIKFEVYHHFSGFMAEVSFWQP